MDSLTIRHEGTRVLIIKNGVLVGDLDHRAALELGRALMAQAKRAEEIAQHEQIAYDEAILLRAGLGGRLGLTNNRHIMDAAKNLAAWDSRLRRYLPGGVQSAEAVGTPAIRNLKNEV